MLDTRQTPRRARSGWRAVATTLAAAGVLGAAVVGVVLATGLHTGPRSGHAASHLAVGLPAALAAVLAWRWWPRRFPSRLSTVGAGVLRVVLVALFVGSALEAVAAFTSADPEGDGLLHDIGLMISVPAMMATLGGLALLALGGLVTLSLLAHRALRERRC